VNFQESLDYLYGLGYELSVKKFGLENTIKLLEALEYPEKNYLKIQIAGTNGKGSTCAFLESICVSAGIKVGKYTSPHLVSITERICIGGAEVSEEKFAKFATYIREVSEKLVETGKLEALPTFFEQVTAIALCVFADEKVEIAILETGLGGRFDATTATSSEIVALTPIDFDHQNILGNTLTEIAGEKAAIIREDTKVFVVPQKKEVESVLLRKCSEVGIEPTFVFSRFQINKVYDDWGDFPFPLEVNLNVNSKNYRKLKLKMLGKHQYENAALAVVIAESLDEFGFKIDETNIKNGLEDTIHKGRLEFYKGILFDGAHNISGAKALREYLDESIKMPIIMIFGAMKEKDLTEIGEILFPKAETLILTKPDNPRSMEVSELLKFVPKKFNAENVKVTETVEEALKIAPDFAAEGLILVTGSLYLVGEVQKLLQNQS
jgi:dihydrofolate synthase/folylpolyglutamate synthase